MMSQGPQWEKWSLQRMWLFWNTHNNNKINWMQMKSVHRGGIETNIIRGRCLLPERHLNCKSQKNVEPKAKQQNYMHNSIDNKQSTDKTKDETKRKMRVNQIRKNINNRRKKKSMRCWFETLDCDVMAITVGKEKCWNVMNRPNVHYFALNSYCNFNASFCAGAWKAQN